MSKLIKYTTFGVFNGCYFGRYGPDAIYRLKRPMYFIELRPILSLGFKEGGATKIRLWSDYRKKDNFIDVDRFYFSEEELESFFQMRTLKTKIGRLYENIEQKEKRIKELTKELEENKATVEDLEKQYNDIKII